MVLFILKYRPEQFNSNLMRPDKTPIQNKNNFIEKIKNETRNN